MKMATPTLSAFDQCLSISSFPFISPRTYKCHIIVRQHGRNQLRTERAFNCDRHERKP